MAESKLPSQWARQVRKAGGALLYADLVSLLDVLRFDPCRWRLVVRRVSDWRVLRLIRMRQKAGAMGAWVALATMTAVDSSPQTRDPGRSLRTGRGGNGGDRKCRANCRQGCHDEEAASAGDGRPGPRKG